jgi:hypothetical protein
MPAVAVLVATDPGLAVDAGDEGPYPPGVPARSLDIGARAEWFRSGAKVSAARQTRAIPLRVQ